VGARSGSQGSWRRSRGSNDLQGARVVGRLQTSVRRIFPGSVWAGRKICLDARGSLKRPPDPLTGPDRIAASEKGAGLERASVKASAIRSISAARSGSIRWKAPWFGLCRRPNPAAMCPGLAERKLLERRGRFGPQKPGSAAKRRKRRCEAIGGRVSNPFRDRGRQRSTRPVRLPQPMGAGGRRPPRGPFRGDPRAAPGRRGLKLPRLKAVLST